MHDLGPQKFDDIDWHEGAADAIGQPREHAFTHIGLFLTWLIRHDLHDPTSLPPDHVRAVQAGEMTGSDLADVVDGKLVSDMMTSEGAAFAAARYERYMDGYSKELAGSGGDYRLPEDDQLYGRIGPIIDRLYAEWVAGGRPSPEPSAEQSVEGPGVLADIDWEALGADGPVGVQFAADGSYEIVRPVAPHEDRELEALLTAGDPRLDPSSVTASTWGSSLLNKVLKTLGVRPRDVSVASGIGGEGGTTLATTAYRVPGVDAPTLLEAFSSVIHRPRGSSWQERTIGGVSVRWAEGVDHGDAWQVAYWTGDGLVFHVSGPVAEMESFIARLSAATP